MALEDFLQFRNVGQHIEDLETPVPVIDLDVVERNVSRLQMRLDKIGIANRPHIKTHKISGLARYQVARGAVGITVQKLGEAEVMAKAGIRDMLLTFNVLGKSKLARLANLMRKADMCVVADSKDLLEGLSHAAGQAGRALSVLVECDTGAGRNGVQSPLDALTLAQAIDRTPGLSFGGLMTYPPAGKRKDVAAFLTKARALCERNGLEGVVTSGGSPDMWSNDGLEPVTEYRAGTYVYFDRSLEARGACGFEDCALSVLTTVVSRPTEDRAIVDAGTKALTSDLLGLSGLGVVQELPGADVYAANEEHGFVSVGKSPVKPKLGEMLRIIPNHVCPVSNLFDEVVFVRGENVLGAVKVEARGMVQ